MGDRHQRTRPDGESGAGATALATLAELIARLRERGDRPAVLGHLPDGVDVWSARRLADAAEGFAAGLVEAGSRRGEVIGLIGPNRPDWIAALLGIVRAGALVMPLPEQITGAELARLLPHSGCRRLVTTAKHLAILAGLEEARGLEVILLEDGDRQGDAGGGLAVRRLEEMLTGARADLPELTPDQPAALLYTSGTTGTPKAVPLTHANLCTNVEGLLGSRLAGPDDRVLLPLPLYHTYPLTVGVLAPLTIGATIVLPAGITGPEITQALKDGRCTIMIAVPRLYEAMLDGIQNRLRQRSRLLRGAFAGLLGLAVRLRRRGWQAGRVLFRPLRRQIGPELRLLASGGAPLDPAVGWRLEALGFQVLTGYGLTETAPILTFNPPGRARIESAGLPVPGVELRIDRSEGADADQGEVQARGPNVFEGYWQNPEATRESFTDDGFFRTGDLGYLDPDGYLHLVGRSKELIVLAGGKNIFPDEVEKVYGRSELVREVAVLEHERRLVGLFVPETGALRQHDAQALRERLQAEIERLSKDLPSHARVGDFAIIRQSLPRTHIGKLRRHELPEIFEQAKAGRRREVSPTTTPEDQALLATPPIDRVWSWLQKRFEGRTLTMDTSPQLDLALDSFDWMSLTMELQERFGAHLSEDAIARVETLRDLLREIEQAGTGAPGAEAEERGLSPEQERWLKPQGWALRALSRVVLGLNRAAMRGLFRLRVEGLEHLPQQGRFLLAPNHLSYLDPPVIAAALSWRQLQHVYWAGWTGVMFRGPLSRLASRVARVVPVDPDRGLTSTLGIGRAVLERDRALVWFPEGQRSKDGRLQPFLPGVGWLIEKTGAVTVPALIEGTHEALPPNRTWPRLRAVRVRFGQPIPPEALLGEGDERERHAQAAERLRAATMELGQDRPSRS